MDRSGATMTMRPDGPGAMWNGLEQDGLGQDPGERMFRAGRLPGDRSLEAERGGNPVGPDQVACANCHGRSGQGLREGGQASPAVNAQALFQPRIAAPDRPAYDDVTLARAIERGTGAGGQPLNSLMPRYRLADTDRAALIGYLHRLRASTVQGARPDSVEVATVVSGVVDPHRREALLASLQGYAEDTGPGRTSGGRRWRLSVWTLDGSPAQRRAQLEANFAARPVAMIVGGLADDSWLAVHQFCEHHAVACLFPDTDLPPLDSPAFHAVYLDRGRALSAQLLGRYLKDHPALLSGGPLVQVLPDQWEGYVPGTALRGYLGRSASRHIRDVTIHAGDTLSEEHWRQLLAREHPAALAIWSANVDLRPLGRALAGQPPLQVFLAQEDLRTGSAGEGRAADPPVVPGLDISVLARALPAQLAQDSPDWQVFRARHDLPVEQLATCANAWFAARLADDALADQPGAPLDLDRMMARVAYAAGTVVQHPLRPGMSLGMGQVFAGKTGWILRPDGAQRDAPSVQADLLLP